jgi:hypothetical protein
MKPKKKLSRGLIRRALRHIPIIGPGAVLALSLETISRKGYFKGGADVLLDFVPVVGLTKSVVEVFTGDLIPDKKQSSTEKTK